MQCHKLQIIRTIMAVWRIRGKIIRTVLCCIVYHNCSQLYAHSYEQFLQVVLILVQFLSVCVFGVFLTGVSLFVIGLVVRLLCIAI